MGYPDFQTYGALARLIASALESAGIPVIGNPVPLYQPGQQSAGSSLVGATVFNSEYTAATNRAGAASIFDGFLSRPMAIACEKQYYNAGQFPTVVPSEVAALMDTGAVIYLCYRPAVNGSDSAALVASLNAHKARAAAATVPTTVKCILWQEPQNAANNMSAAQFITMVGNYQAAVRAVCPLVYDSASHAGSQAMLDYYPGGGNIDGVMADFYCVSYVNNIRVDPLVAQADADGKPFGLGEIGLALSSGNIPTHAQWTSYIDYIQALMGGRLTAGKVNEAVMYYNGTTNNWNTITSANDFRVASLQSLFDLLSAVSAGSSTVPVAAGATVTLTPIAPSPNAGFALAQGMGYDINLRLTAGAGSTIPFMRARTTWYDIDDPNAPVAAIRQWCPPMGHSGGGGSSTWGFGPQQAAFFTVTLKNLDTVPATAKVTLMSSGRQYAEDDWRWDTVGQSSPPAYNLPSGTAVGFPGGGAYSQSLGSVSGLSVPANGAKAWLFSMQAGAANIKVSAAGNNQLTFAVYPQPASIFGSGAIYNKTTNGAQDQIALPRGPVAIEVSNPNAAAVNAFIELVMNGR